MGLHVSSFKFVQWALHQSVFWPLSSFRVACKINLDWRHHCKLYRQTVKYYNSRHDHRRRMCRWAIMGWRHCGSFASFSVVRLSFNGDAGLLEGVDGMITEFPLRRVNYGTVCVDYSAWSGVTYRRPLIRYSSEGRLQISASHVVSRCYWQSQSSVVALLSTTNKPRILANTRITLNVLSYLIALEYTCKMQNSYNEFKPLSWQYCC